MSRNCARCGERTNSIICVSCQYDDVRKAQENQKVSPVTPSKDIELQINDVELAEMDDRHPDFVEAIYGNREQV